jgi:hypothetical protein
MGGKGVHWVRLSLDRDQRRAVANTEKNGFYKRCVEPSNHCYHLYRAAEYGCFSAQSRHLQGLPVTGALHGDTLCQPVKKNSVPRITELYAVDFIVSRFAVAVSKRRTDFNEIVCMFTNFVEASRC